MKTLNITFDFEIDNIKSLGCFVGFIMGLKTMPTENDSFNQFNKNSIVFFYVFNYNIFLIN